jgi:Ca-activated chloride channel family protein
MTEKPDSISKLKAGARGKDFVLRHVSGIVVLLALVSLILWYLTLDSGKPASAVSTVGPQKPAAHQTPCSLETREPPATSSFIYEQSRTPPRYHVVEVPADYIASQGELLVMQTGKKLALPLIHTDVVGRIDGFLARVNVTQKFVNLLDTTIEAVYTFPLPENAAVDSMIMTIGNHRIKGIIKERGEARAIYEQARRDGKTASLLEQERPNIFTQSVANILKNDTILVTISYVAELKYKNASYEFVFPMVVGPRYIPGSPLKPPLHGTENPTDQVQDADRITPPLAPPGMRSGHDISLRLTINAGTDINELSCPSHTIKDVMNADKTRTIEILSGDNIPNKDFILDYSVGQKEIGSVVLCHRQNDDGFFQLIMTPRLSVKKSDIFPRELVFVVDNSGSMGGFPVEKCKEVMTLCLKKMRNNDVFRLIKFSGSTGELSPEPLDATAANVARAVAYVDRMSGGGGTEMMSAINAIFDAPQSEGRRRLVFFLTDGFVGNEAAILTTIRERCSVSASALRSTDTLSKAWHTTAAASPCSSARMATHKKP